MSVNHITRFCNFRWKGGYIYTQIPDFLNLYKGIDENTFDGALTMRLAFNRRVKDSTTFNYLAANELWMLS